MRALFDDIVVRLRFWQLGKDETNRDGIFTGFSLFEYIFWYLKNPDYCVIHIKINHELDLLNRVLGVHQIFGVGMNHIRNKDRINFSRNCNYKLIVILVNGVHFKHD